MGQQVCEPASCPHLDTFSSGTQEGSSSWALQPQGSPWHLLGLSRRFLESEQRRQRNEEANTRQRMEVGLAGRCPMLPAQRRPCGHWHAGHRPRTPALSVATRPLQEKAPLRSPRSQGLLSQPVPERDFEILNIFV